MTHDRLLECDAFTIAYVAALLWSSSDDDGEPLDDKYTRDDLSESLRAAVFHDCQSFQDKGRHWLERAHMDDEQAGHDFALTRNGHGAGFWDGDWPEPSGSALTKLSEEFGGMDLYVGDDGKLYDAHVRSSQ